MLGSYKQFCPVAMAAEILCTRWTVLVLRELVAGSTRFNDLRRAIPTVTQKSLTSTLRRLERNGIVQRELLSSRPVAVEYRITPLGKTLRHPVDVLLGWADKHMPDRFREVAAYRSHVPIVQIPKQMTASRSAQRTRVSQNDPKTAGSSGSENSKNPFLPMRRSSAYRPAAPTES